MAIKYPNNSFDTPSGDEDFNARQGVDSVDDFESIMTDAQIDTANAADPEATAAIARDFRANVAEVTAAIKAA